MRQYFKKPLGKQKKISTRRAEITNKTSSRKAHPAEGKAGRETQDITTSLGKIRADSLHLHWGQAFSWHKSPKFRLEWVNSELRAVQQELHSWHCSSGVPWQKGARRGTNHRARSNSSERKLPPSQEMRTLPGLRGFMTQGLTPSPRVSDFPIKNIFRIPNFSWG